ncbi:MAG: YifB family Mg chelatase-like AAA ATPase [Candidatus Magasanikbacteria bacterium]|nr:YifB family Mg chelatase-like AAA ATPase [Candidatus Magasanikbacteria bacterium]
MLAKVQSAAVLGLRCEKVEVEVDLGVGFPSFTIVGLPDASVQEAKERMKSAIRNCGFDFPATRRIVVNLAPADIHKEGPAYDLPMAMGVLLASLEIDFNHQDSLFVGELGLDGTLRRTNGILPIAIFAREQNIKTIYIPEANAPEAGLVEGLEIIPARDLGQLMRNLSGQEKITPFANVSFAGLLEKELESEFDMKHVRGQEYTKRALEIAASGGHNVLMSGPPGSGKTLLARTLPTILPRLTMEESLEVSKLYSVAGLLTADRPLVTTRPFRTPHHTASGASLVGGGRIPRPGEISLAHRGVLFLDEFPEFSRAVLENLRQPLEDGIITIARAQSTLAFPSRFILVASQNPCPCGYSSDPDKPCMCSPMQVSQYKKKVSGPLLDRIDLHVEVPRLKFQKLTEESEAESSAKIRERVEIARAKQRGRFKGLSIQTNAEMGSKEIKKFCQVDDATMELLRSAVTQMHLSARAYHRILKVARTIADLAGVDAITTAHVAEALQYRAKGE